MYATNKKDIVTFTFFFIFPPGRRLTSSALGAEVAPAAQTKRYNKMYHHSIDFQVEQKQKVMLFKYHHGENTSSKT